MTTVHDVVSDPLLWDLLVIFGVPLVAALVFVALDALRRRAARLVHDQPTIDKRG